MTHKFKLWEMESFMNIIPRHTTIIKYPIISIWDLQLPDDYVDFRLRELAISNEELNALTLDDFSNINVINTQKEFEDFRDRLQASNYLEEQYFLTMLINRNFSEN